MKSKDSLGKIMKERQEPGMNLKTKPETKSYLTCENTEKVYWQVDTEQEKTLKSTHRKGNALERRMLRRNRETSCGKHVVKRKSRREIQAPADLNKYKKLMGL